MQCNPDASRAQSSRVSTVKMVTSPAFVVSASGAKTIWSQYGTFDRDCRVTALFAMTGKPDNPPFGRLISRMLLRECDRTAWLTDHAAYAYLTREDASDR